MTPANVSATPAAVFPGTTAPVTPARDVFDRLMEDLTVTRATLDGVVALIQSSRFTDQDEALCHARTLGWQCLERLRVTYNTIDEASIAEFHRNKKLPRQDSEALPTPSLAAFGDATLHRADTLASMLLAAKALIENRCRDQESAEVFQGCQALTEAANFATELAGEAGKAISTGHKDAPTPPSLAELGGTIGPRAHTLASMVLAAKALMEIDDRDFESQEVFQACQVLAETAKLATALAVDAGNLATAKGAA